MLATLGGTARVMNGFALPAVFVVVAVIFAGVVAFDHRRQRAAQLTEELE
jgi:hypothetical protein